jgi:hypothetical protein
VAQAFAAAKHGAFTLSVDCPVRIHIGMDISRPIFIDDGTTVEFTGSGKFTVDNTFLPAFVIANSSNITLTNWNVEYDASLPVNPSTGGYEQNGQFVAGDAPGSAFSDIRLTRWLTANRAVVFDSSAGHAASSWPGPTNMCAIFLMMGDSSNVAVTGMRVAVPAGVGGNSFVPVVFSINPDFKSGQTVTAATPSTGQHIALPHALTFSNISFDGTYMGWVGSAQNATFENIQSQRYGDLQDAQGGNVGGVNKWFAPPHLFYLKYSATDDPALYNQNIQIDHVIDQGIRVGIARDRGGSDTQSGNALSLKLGCVSCSVNDYTSARPDGFLDLMTSNGLTISNVVASYDSSFLNNIYPGWRFPAPPYSNVSFENVTLTDMAESTLYQPIANSYATANQNLTISGVRVTLNRWKGPATLPLPTIAGQNNNLALDYLVKEASQRITTSNVGPLGLILEASPSTLTPGDSAVLKWYSNQANNCAASGAWSGALPMGGSRTMKVASAGSYDFTLECRNGSGTSNTTLQIVASQ